MSITTTIPAASCVASAAAMAGKRLRSADGEYLGRVEDFVIDLDGGRIGYAVLSFGEFLHERGIRFAVPLRVLSYDPESEAFTVHVDERLLKNAPSFDGTDWPDLADRAWGLRIYSYFGLTPYWE